MGAGYQKPIFLPPKPPTYEPSLPGVFWIETLQDNIPAVFHEYTGKDGQGAHFSVLYAGEHNEDLGVLCKKAAILKETLRTNILVFEYPGFGHHSTPIVPPSEKSYYDTIRAVFNWLTGTKNVEHNRIILMGSGLGSGPVTQLAHEMYAGRHLKKKKLFSITSILEGKEDKKKNDAGMDALLAQFNLAALILVSPILSVASLLPDVRPSQEVFNNAKKIHFVECPTLVLATIDDHFVPIKHSKKLAKYVPSLFKFIELSNVHHDDILDDNSSLDAILDLLEQLDPGSTSSLVLAPVPKMDRRCDKRTLMETDVYKSPQDLLCDYLESVHPGLGEIAPLLVMCGFPDENSLQFLDEPTVMVRPQHSSLGIGIEDPVHVGALLEVIRTNRLLRLFPSVVQSNEITIQRVEEREAGRERLKVLVNGEKAMYTRYSPDYLTEEDFSRQAHVQCKLSHPNILAPIAVVLEDDAYGFVFPEPKRGTLSALLRVRGSKLTDGFLYRTVLSIIRGVTYLHSQTPPIVAKLTPDCIYFEEFGEALIGCLDRVEAPTYHFDVLGDVYLFGLLLIRLAHAKEDLSTPLLFQALLQKYLAIPSITNTPAAGVYESSTEKAESEVSTYEDSFDCDSDTPTVTTTKPRSTTHTALPIPKVTRSNSGSKSVGSSPTMSPTGSPKSTSPREKILRKWEDIIRRCLCTTSFLFLWDRETVADRIADITTRPSFREIANELIELSVPYAQEMADAAVSITARSLLTPRSPQQRSSRGSPSQSRHQKRKSWDGSAAAVMSSPSIITSTGPKAQPAKEKDKAEGDKVSSRSHSDMGLHSATSPNLLAKRKDKRHSRRKSAKPQIRDRRLKSITPPIARRSSSPSGISSSSSEYDAEKKVSNSVASVTDILSKVKLMQAEDADDEKDKEKEKERDRSKRMRDRKGKERHHSHSHNHSHSHRSERDDRKK